MIRTAVFLLACAGTEDSCLWGDGWDGFSDSSHDLDEAYIGYWPQLRTLDQCRQDCCANSGTSRVRQILRGRCMLYGTGALYVALYTVPPVLFSGCRRYGVVHVR